MDKRLRIGELAAQLGLNPKTIRYYEEIGLLPEPRRTPANYRLYGADDRERLRFVVKARTIGLTLEEIGEILGLRRDGVQPCEHVTALLDRKIDGIDRQVRVLEDMRQDLIALRQRAAPSVATGAAVCGIIEHREGSPPLSAARPRRSPLPAVSGGRSADSEPGGGRRNSRRTAAAPAAGAGTLATPRADRPLAPRATRASTVS